jgi:rare lipoprotein A
MIKKLHLFVIVGCLILASCGGSSTTKRTPSSSSTSTVNHGGYYKNDGPHASLPTNLDSIPDAVPRVEALHPYSRKPYIALGKKYYPLETAKNYKKTGVASWYGKLFHGKKTASGETYDMYSMTAAHTVLPLPSYVKVTNVENGRSVIVRVNDRGPFKHEREIDLSYAAAHKLRLIEKGSGLVQVEAIDPAQYVSQPIPLQQQSGPLEETTSTRHYVQAGAFGDENNAIALENRLLGLNIEELTRINRMYNGGLHRLTIGPYQSKEQAEKIAKFIQNKLNISTIITFK